MSRVDFYHLQIWPLERALPELLERVLAKNMRAIVAAVSEERVKELNSSLWTYKDDSWLPHGASMDGDGSEDPIWLTDKTENPNHANVLVITEGAELFNLNDFERCLDLFEGTSEEHITNARLRWRQAKDDGHDLYYWQQEPTGRWVEKARYVKSD